MAEYRDMVDDVWDRIDAPCSGEGMFRKSNIDTYSWNMANVKACAIRQFEILQSVKNSLRVGGRLVYSTCTYNIEENEGVVAKFLNANPDYKLVALPEMVNDATVRGVDIEGCDTHLCGRRYPHVHSGEGQFIAVMERVGGRVIDRDDCYQCASRKETIEIEKALCKIVDTSQFTYWKKGDNIYVLPQVDIDISGLNVTSLGVFVGTMKKGVIDISHSFYKAFGQLFYNKIELMSHS